MSECTNQHYKKLLHAYELGMLDENERRLFEIHLLECEYCLEMAQKSKKAVQLMRSDDIFKKIVRKFLAGRSEVMTFRTHPRFWKKVITTSIAATIIFIILILKPWHIEISPDLLVYADNRLTIMYFENLDDPGDGDKLGEIITNLLIMDLSESQFINVLSGQRLYDILRLLEIEDTAFIDKDIVSRVARKANAKWILTGAILQEEPYYVLASQLIDVADGDLIASQRVTGEPGESIFAVVDKLTVNIKQDLSLPSGAIEEPDPMVSDLTTHSPEAYRYYVEGVDYYNKYYFDEAKKSFRKSLQHDSTFAMAYYYLANLEDTKFIYKAIEYSYKVSELEKYYIDIFKEIYERNIEGSIELLKSLIRKYPEEKKAYNLLAEIEARKGNHENAVLYFSEAIAIDPLYKRAYNLIAYSYSAIGDMEKALWAINKYIEIAPNEANPYDSRAEIFAANGYVDNAIESYQKALSLKHDFHMSLAGLGLMYLFKGEFDRADSCSVLLVTIGNEAYRSTARLHLIYTPMFKGKFREALRLLNITILDSDNRYPSYHMVKAHIHSELGEWADAIKEIRKAIEIDEVNYLDQYSQYQHLYIQMLAESGNMAEAEQHAENMKRYHEDKNLSMDYYFYALGTIELAQGNYENAIVQFNKIENYYSEFHLSYMAGKAFLLAGNYGKAREILENTRNRFTRNRAMYGVWSVKLYYYLGLAYEETGLSDKALETYDVFLSFWENADPGIDEVEDANRRRTQLRYKI